MSSAAAYQAAERQCGAVYQALDSRNPSKALQLVDGILSRTPSALASSLRILALARLPDRARAHAAADAVMRSPPPPADTNATHALCLALGVLGRRAEEARLLDEAASAQPGSLELGKRALLALVRAAQWQRASQVSLRLSKAAASAVATLPARVKAQMQSEADSLLWGAVCAFLLLSRTPEAAGAKLALPLAQRMAASQLATRPLGPRSDEEAWLAATVNARIAASKSGEEERKGLLAALEALQGGEGDTLVARNLGLQELRRSLRKQVGQWEEVLGEARDALKAGERNWTLVEALVEASVELAKAGNAQALKEAATEIEALGGGRDRTARLAIMHLRGKALEAQLGSHLVSNDEALAAQLEQDIKTYLVDLGDLACVADDLDSYVRLLPSAQRANLAQEWKGGLPASLPDNKALYASLNRVKLARLASQPSSSASQELELASTYITSYAAALPLGAALPETEMQPADDFALLASHALLSSSPLVALSLLAHALKRSPKGYRLRIVRARLLARAGATSAARHEAGRVGIKGVQWDSLGWIVGERATTSAVGDEKTDAKIGREIREIYEENARELPKLISRAFEYGTYSRVEEFVDFSEELGRSIARQLARVDAARSALLLGASAEQVQQLTEEVRLVREALKQGTFDNRDFNVLPTLLPIGSTSVEEQLSLGSGKRPGITYVCAMLNVLSVALGLDVGAEAEETNEELTESEADLHALALTLSRADGQVDEKAITAFFDRRLAEVRSSTLTDPARAWRALHSASTAHEGYTLLRSVSTRLSSLSPLLESTRSTLACLATALEAFKPALDVSAAEEQALLPLFGGDVEEVRAMLRSTREEVESSRTWAFGALSGRLREC